MSRALWGTCSTRLRLRSQRQALSGRGSGSICPVHRNEDSPRELPSSIPAGVAGASSTAGARRVRLCPWQPSLLQCSRPLAPLAGQRELVSAGTGWVPAGGRGSFQSGRLTCSHPAAGGGPSWMHIAGSQPGGSSSGSSEPMLRGASSRRGPERRCPRLHPPAALPGCVLSRCARSSCQDAQLLEASVWSGGCTELSSSPSSVRYTPHPPVRDHSNLLGNITCRLEQNQAARS